MKIRLDKKKYRKRIISLIFLSSSFSLAFIMMILMNILEHNMFDWKKLGITIFLLLMLSIFTYLSRFYYRLKRTREFVMEFENGFLNDYSKPFNRTLFLSIDSIKTITFWRETQGIIQFKIVTQKDNKKLGGLINQMKGNHLYISDYIVDTEELLSMVKLIENDTFNNKQAKVTNVHTG